jgi:hypothetical protein
LTDSSLIAISSPEIMFVPIQDSCVIRLMVYEEFVELLWSEYQDRYLRNYHFLSFFRSCTYFQPADPSPVFSKRKEQLEVGLVRTIVAISAVR